MKKTILIALSTLVIAGCNFSLEFESVLDLNEKVPPPTVWNTLDESVLTLTDINQSETLDTVNFTAGNDEGAATIMYFNSPITTALPPVVLGTGPDAGDPLDSTFVVVPTPTKPQRFRISTRFKIDSGDSSIVGGQDSEGRQRYTYTGSRTCQATFHIEATWDEAEEKLTLIEQVPTLGTTQGDIFCEAGCEAPGGCPTPDFVNYTDFPLSMAQYTEMRGVFFLDNELDLTLVGDQYEDNEVSFRLVIQDLLPGPAPVPGANLRPIATQYDITAQFVRP